MPTWSEITKEIEATPDANGSPNFDAVRRKYLLALHKYTKRNVIIYASRWVQGVPPSPSQFIQITDGDLHGFMEVVHGMRGKKLDLILHSPGGEVGAAEGIVHYLRTKFSDIRVIVPHLAMSAATMIACASDAIVIGKHSYLGPTDPQLSSLDGKSFPATAVLDQFAMAKRDCDDKSQLNAWIPILPHYGPALLMQCQNAVDLSQKLVNDWLSRYMFRKKKDGKKHAESIAKWLSDHTSHKVHSRHIDRTRFRLRGMNIQYLEEDDQLQDLVLSIYHTVAITFTAKPGVMKIIENHNSRAFITSIQAPTFNLSPISPLQLPAQPAHS